MDKVKLAIKIKQALARGFLKDVMYKGYVDLTPIKVPINHNGTMRYVDAKRG